MTCCPVATISSYGPGPLKLRLETLRTLPSLTPEALAALEALSGFDADRKALRTRYTELLRRYHPDHNGGDRTKEVVV